MKTKRFCKSTVSLLLVFMMLVSMLTVGIVSTSAAEADVAETGYDGIVFKGAFDNWSEHYLTYNSSSGYFECTVTVSAGKHQIEVVDYSDVLNCDATIQDVTTTSGYQLYQNSGTLYWQASGGTYDIKYWEHDGNNEHYLYIYKQGGGGGTTTEDFPYELEDTDSRALYFVNTANWSSVYCYSWPDNGNGSVGWPGKLMTKAGDIKFDGHDVYYVQVTAGENNVKFTNNSGTETGNFTFDDFSYYDTTGRRGDVNTYGSTVTYKDITVGIEESVTNPTQYQIAWWIQNVDSRVATITAKNETVKLSLGSGETKNFALYTAQIPDTSTGYMWTTGGDNGSFGSPIVFGENDAGNILLLCDNSQTTEIVENTPVDDPDDPTTLKQLYFMDNSSNDYMTQEDADIYAKFNTDSKSKAMKQRVDTISGNTLWNIKVPSGATSVTFTRKNKFGDKIGNGEWTESLSGKTTGYYKAAGSGSGFWESDETTFSPSSDSDIKNFWYGVWVDTRGEEKGTDAVRWWKDSNNEYHIFLPTHTPDTFKLYTSFANFTVNGKTASKGNPVEISGINNGQSYSYSSSAGSGTVVFHRSANVSSLMLFTDDQLWTDTMSGDTSEYKDGIETKGNIYLYDNNGDLVNNVVNDEKDQTVLKKIKGRGNSSFEASMVIYGKYAYNFNLQEKVDLTKLPDGSNSSTAAKKWCLLANNVDHSMLRNTFAYSLASDIGLAYSPKTRHVDVYDNGEYIGAYTIIEKVEYGVDKSLMHDLVSLDDEHEKWYEDYNESINNSDYDDYDKEAIKVNGSKDSPKTYQTSSGSTYKYVYWDSNKTGFSYEHPENDDSFKNEFNFLLEHELDDRYYHEASWFISAEGQHVVVKYPEFATQREMMWAMDMYDKLEKAAYSTQTLASIEAAADAESFAKMYLIQELGLNLDACATSYYMYNDRTTNKLVAGPVWDFDWSFGSYYKTKVKYNGTSSNLSNPEQMYVKYKDMTNGIDSGWTNKRNLQAQLTVTKDYWTLCKKIWTNDVEPIIKTYIDENTNDTTDTGKLLGWMNDIEASAEMNNIRWNHAYEKDETANWGTKLTSDYDKGTYDFKASQRGTSNSKDSSVYNYANTVYYLNDWLKERMDYMSTGAGDDSLYDESLLTYRCQSINFTPVVTDSELTVTPSATILDKDGNPVSDSNLEWQLVVGTVKGEFGAYPTAQTVTLTNKENDVYINVRVKNDPTFVFDSKSQKVICENTAEYTVSNVTIDIVDNKDTTLTVTPSATVKLGDASVKLNECTYTLVVNGTTVAENMKFSEEPSVNITDPVEGSNQFVLTVYAPDGTSATKTETYMYSATPDGTPVTVTVMFKSSSSYRYRPSIAVGEEDFVAMTQSESIGPNKTQTQSYYWYTYEVEAIKGTPVTITFKNSYTMVASFTIEDPTNCTRYFGVDNLNVGKTAVELPSGSDESSVAIRNFYQTAAHMVQPDATIATVAYTSIGGTRRMLGDSTLDNSLSIFDATATQLDLVGKEELSSTASALADYNLDGVKSIMDVTMTQMYLAQ